MYQIHSVAEIVGEIHMTDQKLVSLLENQVLTVETKQAILEAWNSQVEQIKKQAKSEIREEFAARFDRDKHNIVEAMDQKITQSLEEAVQSIRKERDLLENERIAYKKNTRKHAERFLNESKQVLEAEIRELQQDRQSQAQKMNEFVSFVQKGIQQVVQECHQEHVRLQEDRAKLNTRMNVKIQESRRAMVKKLAEGGEQFITATLKSELSQLKQEISEARKIHFGKKIYEAFASEFNMGFFESSKEFKKLTRALEERDRVLESMSKKLARKDSEIKEIQEQMSLKEHAMKRQVAIASLTGSLGKHTKEIMEEMLESVPTNKLQEHFDRYLPMLMEQTSSNKNKTHLKENHKTRSFDGNRQMIVEETEQNDTNNAVSSILDSFNKIKSK